MIRLHHVGEPLVAGCLRVALEENMPIPCYFRSDGTWRQSLLQDSYPGALVRLGALAGGYEAGRLISPGLKMDPMHAVDIFLHAFGVAVPIEVKFGSTVFRAESFYGRFIHARPLKISEKGNVTGSVPSILEEHSKNNLPAGLAVRFEKTDIPVARSWGLVVTRDQSSKILDYGEGPSGLAFLMVYESLRDVLGSRFEDVASALWPSHGQASMMLK